MTELLDRVEDFLPFRHNLAGNERRVRRHAAPRGEDPFGSVHPFDVFRRGLDAGEDHELTPFFPRFGVRRVEHDTPRRGARSGVQSLRQEASRFHRGLLLLQVEDRPQELVELIGFDAS